MALAMKSRPKRVGEGCLGNFVKWAREWASERAREHSSRGMSALAGDTWRASIGCWEHARRNWVSGKSNPMPWNGEVDGWLVENTWKGVLGISQVSPPVSERPQFVGSGARGNAWKVAIGLCEHAKRNWSYGDSCRGVAWDGEGWR